MNPPDPIPMKKWGKDHWSTLAYLETRCVDYKGMIAFAHMRCDKRLHRRMAHRGSDFGSHPTRLQGGEKLENHDDWLCIEDAIRFGLVEMIEDWPPRFKLTPRGLVACNTLRNWKASGGTFGNFSLDMEIKDGKA